MDIPTTTDAEYLIRSLNFKDFKTDSDKDRFYKDCHRHRHIFDPNLGIAVDFKIYKGENFGFVSVATISKEVKGNVESHCVYGQETLSEYGTIRISASNVLYVLDRLAWP